MARQARNASRRAHPLRSISIAILSLALTGACATDVDGGPPAGGTISGIIDYDGAAAGGGRALAIAVNRTYPPSGPPVAWRLVERYELPLRYSFDGLAAGTYWVGGSIDVDPADTRHAGMLNAARDPHGYARGGRRIEVGAFEGAAGADVVLEDPR